MPKGKIFQDRFIKTTSYFKKVKSRWDKERRGYYRRKKGQASKASLIAFTSFVKVTRVTWIAYIQICIFPFFFKNLVSWNIFQDQEKLSPIIHVCQSNINPKNEWKNQFVSRSLSSWDHKLPESVGSLNSWSDMIFVKYFTQVHFQPVWKFALRMHRSQHFWAPETPFLAFKSQNVIIIHCTMGKLKNGV